MLVQIGYNDLNKTIAIKITQGDINDKVSITELTKKVKKSTYTGKSYIGTNLFKALYKKRGKLITGINKYCIHLTNKKLLQKKWYISAIFRIKKIP